METRNQLKQKIRGGISSPVLVGQPLRLPTPPGAAPALQLVLVKDTAQTAMFVLTRAKNSTDVESPHQFLARFHREFGTHATQHFLPPIRVHRRQTTDEFVARFPFRILACADTDCQQRRDGPNRNVCRSHRMNKETKTPATTKQSAFLVGEAACPRLQTDWQS